MISVLLILLDFAYTKKIERIDINLFLDYQIFDHSLLPLSIFLSPNNPSTLIFQSLGTLVLGAPDIML